MFASASAPAALHQAVKDRLGWLDAPALYAREITRLREFAAKAGADGLAECHLLGMGGSSLCAEVVRETSPSAEATRFTVLDTTDERAINQAAAQLHPERALFLVASKSGSTIEVSSLEHYFRSVVSRTASGNSAGRHFAAITDPGTSLVTQAQQLHYRDTFLNAADIGGRYSALSLFGLVPSALMNVDIARLLGDGRAMADRCQADSADNPGVALGAFMAEQALAGRDKLTILLSPKLGPLGQWIEQLIAESTGKQGRGILPVVDEPIGAPADYGSDRAFVAAVESDTDLTSRVAALEAAGHPVFRLDASATSIGAEFFRWEFATAVAGAALGINPFDEPNVREAKNRTGALLDTYRTTGALRVDPPLKPMPGLDGCLVRSHRSQAVKSDAPHRYIAMLDYLPFDAARAATVAHVRARLRGLTKFATTHGRGPRYLHSTGQYHKGGPNSGLFVLLTAADERSTPVPGTDYSFSVLKQAQALGDFEALVAADRNVVHYHFENASADFSHEIDRVLSERARVLA